MGDFGIALERRYHHVIRRHQEEDREQDQEKIRRIKCPAPIAAQARALDETAPCGRGGDRGCRHPVSLPRLRTPRKMKTAAIARIGNMNSDVAAPSGRSPERMPSRNA